MSASIKRKHIARSSFCRSSKKKEYFWLYIESQHGSSKESKPWNRRAWKEKINNDSEDETEGKIGSRGCWTWSYWGKTQKGRINFEKQIGKRGDADKWQRHSRTDRSQVKVVYETINCLRTKDRNQARLSLWLSWGEIIEAEEAGRESWEERLPMRAWGLWQEVRHQIAPGASPEVQAPIKERVMIVMAITYNISTALLFFGSFLSSSGLELELILFLHDLGHYLALGSISFFDLGVYFC